MKSKKRWWKQFKYKNKIFGWTTATIAFSLPIITTSSILVVQQKNHQSISSSTYALNQNSAITNYGSFFNKIYHFKDLFNIKDDQKRLGAQDHYYKIFDLFFSWIKWGKNWSSSSLLYQWNDYFYFAGKYKDKNEKDHTSSSILTPKITYESNQKEPIKFDFGKLIKWLFNNGLDMHHTINIDKKIYLSQDIEFRQMNDTLNVVSGSLLTKAKSTSFFYELFRAKLLPVIIKKFAKMTGNKVPIIADLSTISEEIVKAIILILVSKLVPPPINQILLGVLKPMWGDYKQNFKGAILNILLYIIKIFITTPYTISCLDYSMRIEQHTNADLKHEYLLSFVKYYKDQAILVKNDGLNALNNIVRNFYGKSNIKVDFKPNYDGSNNDDLEEEQKQKVKKTLDIIAKLLTPITILVKILLYWGLFEHGALLTGLFITLSNLINNFISMIFRPIIMRLLFFVYWGFDKLYKLPFVAPSLNLIINILKQLVNAYNKGAEAVKELWDKTIGKIIDLINKIKDSINKFKDIIKKIKDTINKIKEAIEKFKKIIQKIKAILDKIFKHYLLF